MPSDAARLAGAAGVPGVCVTTIVLPLAATANVPPLAHFVPMDMFAALAELPLMIVQEYELHSLKPAGADAGRLIVSAEAAPIAPEAEIRSQSVLPVPVTSHV